MTFHSRSLTRCKHLLRYFFRKNVALLSNKVRWGKCAGKPADLRLTALGALGSFPPLIWDPEKTVEKLPSWHGVIRRHMRQGVVAEQRIWAGADAWCRSTREMTWCVKENSQDEVKVERRVFPGRAQTTSPPCPISAVSLLALRRACMASLPRRPTRATLTYWLMHNAKKSLPTPEN